MSTPKVSVILPCYNGEKYLRQCVDSILNQTLSDLELICVDDGSSDSTLDILRGYEAADPRVRVLIQENAGAGAARNNGLRLAKGEYLSFLDADDFFEPEMLRETVDAAEQYRADYVVFGSDRYHMDTGAFAEVPWTILRGDIPPYMPFSYRELTDNIFLCFVGWAWDKLYRRSFVEKKNLWFQEQRTTNDMLFVFSGLVTAKRIAVVDKVLAHQRRGSSESLSVTREKSWHCFYDALTALKERLIQEGIFWELEKDYINYSLHFCLWHLNSLAEPSHTLLKQKLLKEWFDALGISDKPESYFWNREEYREYFKLSGVSGAERSGQTVQSGCGAEKELPDICFKKYYSGAEEYDSSKPYAINIQFDRIRDEIMKNPDQWKCCQSAYWHEKLACYQKVSSLLGPEVKKEFADRMQREFRRALRLDQLQQADYSCEDWEKIHALVLRADGLAGRISANPIIRRLSPCIPKKIKQLIVGVLNWLCRIKRKLVDKK